MSNPLQYTMKLAGEIVPSRFFAGMLSHAEPHSETVKYALQHVLLYSMINYSG